MSTVDIFNGSMKMGNLRFMLGGPHSIYWICSCY